MNGDSRLLCALSVLHKATGQSLRHYCILKAGSDILQAVLLQCLEALCQYSEQVVSHHKAVATHLLPALAAAVGRAGESRDTRFLCLKLLCDVILHFLLETDLYSPSQQAQAAASGETHSLSPITAMDQNCCLTPTPPPIQPQLQSNVGLFPQPLPVPVGPGIFCW